MDMQSVCGVGGGYIQHLASNCERHDGKRKKERRFKSNNNNQPASVSQINLEAQMKAHMFG